MRVASDKLPDIILLDMMLPKISGVEVLRGLKANPITVDIPVIVLTNLSQINEKKLLSEVAAAYFEKSTLENSTRASTAWPLQYRRSWAGRNGAIFLPKPFCDACSDRCGDDQALLERANPCTRDGNLPRRSSVSAARSY